MCPNMPWYMAAGLSTDISTCVIICIVLSNNKHLQVSVEKTRLRELNNIDRFIVTKKTIWKCFKHICTHKMTRNANKKKKGKLSEAFMFCESEYRYFFFFLWVSFDKHYLHTLLPIYNGDMPLKSKQNSKSLLKFQLAWN